MRNLEFVNLITAEVACEPGDEDRIATEIAAIEGVRRVTCTVASVLAAEPASVDG